VAQSPETDALGDPLPNAARLRLGTLRFRHPSSVIDLALSPDEKTIVTVGREIIAWETDTGKERWRASATQHGLDLPSASYGVRGLAFFGDGSQFYTPGREYEAIVWETETGRPGLPPAGPQGQSRAIDVTADGKRLVLGSAKGIVVFDNQANILYEIANRTTDALKMDGNDRLTFGGHYSLGRFSPDGKLLAVVTSELPEVIRLHDAVTGQEQRRVALKSKLVRLAFSPDGQQMAATERDSAVRVYEVATGKPVWSYVVPLDNPYENYTSAITYSPDGKTLAVCATDYRIHLFDATTGKETGQLVGHRWNPWALAFTANSKTLFSSGWDGAVRRWDVAARKQLPLPAGIHATGPAAASRDGRMLAFAEDSGAIRLVDAKQGALVRRLELAGTQYSQLAFSSDSRRLAGGGTCGDEVHVAVWDLADGQLQRRWDWPKGRDPHSTIEGLVFTPDGNHLAAAVFRQSAAYLWELRAGEKVADLPHRQIYGLSFSPDGKRLATAGWDSTIRFWETNTGKELREHKVTAGAAAPLDRGRNSDLRMYTVCYAPSGGLLATAHMDSQVRIWQAEDMTLLCQFAVNASFTYGAMSFSPDGLWLATGTSGGQVSLWDPLSGQQVWSTGRHRDYVYTVGFGRDGRTLLSGGRDGACYLWDLQPEFAKPGEDLTPLLDDLVGFDGVAAYQALWALASVPDRAVALLDAKRLKERLAALQDPEQSAAARRAVSLLALLGTPAATQLLKDWAKDDPGILGQSAAACLKTTRS
jgi:WD40 repeat protein